MRCYISKLPNYTLEEIFCKIPIATLIQCRFVCKSWKHILGNPNFTKLHQQLTDTVLCVQEIRNRNGYGITEEYKRNIHWLEFKGKSSCINLGANCNVVPRSLESSFPFRFINSCNGLVCLLIHPSHQNFPNVVFMRITNPVTGESMNLPPLDKEKCSFWYLCGLGFSPKTNQFKAVIIFTHGEGFQAEVCTIGTSSWRSIEVSLPLYDYFTEKYKNLRFKSAVCANGSLHWLIKRIELNSIELCVFDLDTEQFRQMAGPPPLQEGFENPRRECRVDMGIYKDTLRVWVSGNLLDVWQMKEYGVAESWTKILVVKEIYAGSELFNFLKNGDILVLRWLDLYSYNPGKEIFTMLDNLGSPFHNKSKIFKGENGYDAVLEYKTRWFVHKPNFVSLKDMVAQDNLKV